MFPCGSLLLTFVTLFTSEGWRDGAGRTSYDSENESGWLYTRGGGGDVHSVARKDTI